MSFTSFLPSFVFLLISFMAFIHQRKFNFYNVKCCLSWLLSFTAFLGRPFHLTGPSPGSGMRFLLVSKTPVLRPASLLSQAVCLCQAGWWGREREVPAYSHRGGISSCLVIHLFLSFSLCFSVSFSLQISAF